MKTTVSIGWRLVAIVFVVTLLSNLPTGNIPNLVDIYRACIAAGIAALLLLEKGEGGDSNLPVSQ